MTNVDDREVASTGPAQPAFPFGSRKLTMAVGRLLFILLLLVIWELSSGRIVAEYMVSRPTEIGKTFFEWLMDGTLLYHTSITATEAFLGFLIGGTAGMAFGVLLGRRQLLAEFLDPMIMAFYSMPKLALAPLFIIWLGIDMTMKVVLTAVIVFFLVFLNTYSGVKSVSRELESILYLMGASERHVLLKVVVPSCVTWVFTGLRISVPYALIGAIVGELMASNQGLGSLLVLSQGQFDTAGVFAALAAIVTLAAILNTAVRYAERKVMPWRTAEELREGSI